jgi:hypothetical protein
MSSPPSSNGTLRPCGHSPGWREATCDRRLPKSKSMACRFAPRPGETDWRACSCQPGHCPCSGRRRPRATNRLGPRVSGRLVVIGVDPPSRWQADGIGGQSVGGDLGSSRLALGSICSRMSPCSSRVGPRRVGINPRWSRADSRPCMRRAVNPRHDAKAIWAAARRASLRSPACTRG